jgi:glycosyltransferase involved in cell wall biosynthesis
MATVVVGAAVPAVSVVMPVRNAAATVAVALKSTLRARGVALEVIVLDHGSTDGSRAVIDRIAARDARVRVVDASGMAGLADVRDRGVHEARAEVVACMDADDVMHPLRLAEDTAQLARDTTLSAVCSRARVVRSTNAGLRAYVAWQNACLTRAEHAREVWIEQPVCHPATTFRRRALVDVGYGAAVRALGGEAVPEDYALFLALLTTGHAIEKRAEVRHGWREHAVSAARFDRDVFARMKARALVARVLAGRPVVVAGAGTEGGRIARALLDAGARLRAFVDVDPKKIGRVRHGVEVRPVSELAVLRAGAVVVAAVGTSGARAVVRAQVATAGCVEGVDAFVVA